MLYLAALRLACLRYKTPLWEETEAGKDLHLPSPGFTGRFTAMAVVQRKDSFPTFKKIIFSCCSWWTLYFLSLSFHVSVLINHTSGHSKYLSFFPVFNMYSPGKHLCSLVFLHNYSFVVLLHMLLLGKNLWNIWGILLEIMSQYKQIISYWTKASYHCQKEGKESVKIMHVVFHYLLLLLAAKLLNKMRQECNGLLFILDAWLKVWPNLLGLSCFLFCPLWRKHFGWTIKSPDCFKQRKL